MKIMPFDSRDIFYKSVFGSVAAHREFRLRVLLKCDGYVKGVVAVFDRDGTAETRFELLDDQNNLEGGFYTRSCNAALPEGLYFYHFIMYTEDGERMLLNMGGGVGEFDPKSGERWQLTVYDESFKTPDSLKGGLIYQIFPDRFYKYGDIIQSFDDRYLRQDWGGMPEYRQTDDPCHLGNDYFGGNLKGITKKLGYLKRLGVSIIYLNPVFEAHSNHRYNTADYFKIDPMLGTEEDFITLCRRAKAFGIAVILDGVFSHTGNDSVYFNETGRYGNSGAYNDPDSQYCSWYKFNNYPNDYACWWGIKSLPEVNENDPSFSEFITGENGVIRYWIKRGASGFRLDVADELPDEFLDKIRRAVKAENENAVLIGEVWEDATNKISYSVRRRFLRGKQLDSVMNYPFASAILSFVKGGDGTDFAEAVMTVLENYPKPALDLLMNHIGTHDTARAITVLSSNPADGRDREWQARQTLTEEQYSAGVRRLKLAAVLQYTLVGIPSLYYGDEAGTFGYSDPFCRGCFPWGSEDTDLTSFYCQLGKMRQEISAFKTGELRFLAVGLGYVVYKRSDENSSVIIAVNRWTAPDDVWVDFDFTGYKALFGTMPEQDILHLDAEGFTILFKENQQFENK